MSCSTVEIEHFSHPKHPLVLKEDDVIGADAKCCLCNKPVIGSPTNEIEENGIVDDEPDLVQFPLPGKESLFDLIITQCSKLRVEFQGEGGNNANTSMIANDPHIIEKHWSHQEHPLELHQLTVSVNNNNDNDDNDDGGGDDRRVLICDGCVQPITLFDPCYYACIQYDFFLHSFCANKLPHKLPIGASPFHPSIYSLFYIGIRKSYIVI
ncbi:hypothetical protein AgCh_019219 [Apium graveolens]